MTGRVGSLFGWRPIRFIVVGTGANLLLFALSYLFQRAGMPAFAAGAAAYIIAFAAAYIAQRDWTFDGAHNHSRVFPRYAMAQLGCVATSSVMGHICVEGFGAPPFWASVAITATAGVTSYLLSAFWVFAGISGDARTPADEAERPGRASASLR